MTTAQKSWIFKIRIPFLRKFFLMVPSISLYFIKIFYFLAIRNQKSIILFNKNIYINNFKANKIIQNYIYQISFREISPIKTKFPWLHRYILISRKIYHFLLLIVIFLQLTLNQKNRLIILQQKILFFPRNTIIFTLTSLQLNKKRSFIIKLPLNR